MINKFKIGIVSGYFNPLHYGHIEYINAAKDQCGYLIAIINSDLQVTLKKSKPFMDQEHRRKIIQNLKTVNKAIISIDTDGTQRKTLELIRKGSPTSKMAFFNSGDRKTGNLEPLESVFCRANNIFEIVLDLPKIYSSSKLLNL